MNNGDRPEGEARSGGVNQGDRGERFTAMPAGIILSAAMPGN